jgi:hypothetical protein
MAKREDSIKAKTSTWRRGLISNVCQWILIIAIAAIAMLFYMSLSQIPYIYTKSHKDIDYAAAGTFGDSFGFANSVINFLGLIALIATLNYQRLAIRQQQEGLTQSTLLDALSAEINSLATRANMKTSYIAMMLSRLESHESSDGKHGVNRETVASSIREYLREIAKLESTMIHRISILHVMIERQTGLDLPELDAAFETPEPNAPDGPQGESASQ